MTKKYEESVNPLFNNLTGILNNINDAVYIKNTEGIYTYLNQTAAELIGLAINDIVGKKDADIFPADVLDTIRSLDKQVLTTQTPISQETHYSINQTDIWFHTVISPAFSDDKKLLGLIGISRDISDQKKLESQLQKYTSELDIILEYSTDAIYRKDLYGRYVFINKAGAAMMKLSPEQIIGHTDSELFGEQVTKKIRKTDRTVIQKQTAQTLTSKYTEGDQEYWFNISISPAFNHEKKLIGLVGISKNITNLKQLELELREKNEQLITILESSNDAIFSKNLAGEYLFVNKACEAFIGKTAAELIGKTDNDIFPFEAAETIRALDKKVMASRESISTEECFGIKGNESWYYATISPAFSSQGDLVGVIGISRNMTEYRRTQEELWNSENRYHSLYHDTPALFITLDVNGDVVEANAYGAKRLGYTPEQLKNTSIYNIIPDEDKNIFRRNLQMALDNPGTLYQAERRYISKDGSIIWGKDFLRVVFDKNGNPSIPLLSEDMTTAKILTQELDYRDSHDPLTGLYNRTKFETYLDRALQTALNKNLTHVLFILELNDFKLVNESYGPKAGDNLLISIANLLSDHARERDIIARFGGDEFVVLIENSTIPEIEHNLDIILDAISHQDFKLAEKAYFVSASIGVVEINNSTTGISQSLTQAETAVFAAKQQGKNRFHIYDETDTVTKARKVELDALTNINIAIESDLLSIYVQKIAPVAQDQDLPAYEVLIRMIGPNGEIIPPNSFIPVLEHHRVAHKLDRWVIVHTFKWLSENRYILDQINYFSINLSGQSIGNEHLLDDINQLFIDYDIPHQKICFEVTETAAIAVLEQALDFLNTLRHFGCLIALDDFGAGLSSFQYLRELPVDYVKIDGAFIRNICENKADHMLTQGMIDLVRNLGMKTVAEYVENEDILAALTQMKVDAVQGYYITKPVPIDDIHQ